MKLQQRMPENAYRSRVALWVCQ